MIISASTTEGEATYSIRTESINYNYQSYELVFDMITYVAEYWNNDYCSITYSFDMKNWNTLYNKNNDAAEGIIHVQINYILN